VPFENQARFRHIGKVVYAVAADDALSRPNSSATACSITVPLEEARVVAHVQHGGIGERELAKILFGDEALVNHLERFGYDVGEVRHVKMREVAMCKGP
jgi:hypothetical protein